MQKPSYQVEYERRMTQTGRRVTQDRLAMLHYLFQFEEAVSIDDLAARLRAAENRISRSTVYRTVQQAVEFGMVSVVMDGMVELNRE